MNDIRQIIVASLIVGILLGFIGYDFFLASDEIGYKVMYKETTKTDTVYIHEFDTVYLTKKDIKHVYLRDTILIEPIEPKIKAFKATFPLLYGNAYLNGEVLGEVLKTSLITDFRIPTVTNTITKEKTETITKETMGIYAGAAINNLLQPSIIASYQDKRYIFSYQYQMNTQAHQIGVQKKIFGK